MPETKEEKSNPKKELETKLASNALEKQKIDAGLKESKEAVQETQRELIALKNNIESAGQTLNKAFRSLDLMGWLIPFVTLIVYYVIYFSLGLPLNALALDGLAIAIPLALILRLAVFVARIQLREENTPVTASIKESLLGFLGSSFKITVRGSKLDKALSNVETFAGRLTTAVRSYVPGVKEYYEGKERIQNQLVFVRTMKNSLIEYGFKLGDKVEGYLDGFYSLSDNIDDWLDEATKNLSTTYGQPRAIFKLAYGDYVDNDSARKNEWHSIRNTQQVFQQFAVFLIHGNLLDIPKAYREPIRPTSEFVANTLASLDDFTLTEAKMTVSRSFATLDTEKEDLLRTLWANNVQIAEGDRTEFSKLLPAADSQNGLLLWLEKHTKVQSYVLQLFFYDFRAQNLQRDEYFSDLKADPGKIAVLSKELLSRKIISVIERDDRRREEDISNLTSYLGKVSRYDKAGIASNFSKYSRLFEYSMLILAFMKNQSICQKDAELSFEKLLTQTAISEADFLTQLQIATKLLIAESSSYPSSAAEWLEPIALAVMTVFLDESEDMFLRSAICRRVAGVVRTVKILYEYSWTNDDEQDKITADRTSLVHMIRRVIDGETRSDVYVTEFTRYLTTGFLYRRIKEIPDRRLRDMEKQLTSVVDQMDFKSKLDRHLSALKTVLESELNTGTIMEGLRMQLVGAYTITVPTGADTLSAVIDDLLPDTCEELGKNDPTYVGLFLKAEAGEARVGRYTRIGLVPFRMDFKEFANRLENAYRIALSKYEQSGEMSHPIDEYLANVIRIFPTTGYFRQLSPAEKHDGKGADDLLADILRPLMIRKFGNIRSLEIIASLKTPNESNVAIRNMLANWYDMSGGIYLIAKDELDGVLFNPALRDYVEVGKLDETLASRFNKQSLSELAITIYRSSIKSGLENIKQSLQVQISEICNAIRARPPKEELENISTIIFQALYDVGMILGVIPT